MKKLLTLILAGILAATLISCTEEKKDDKKADKNEVVDTIKVNDIYELTEALYAKQPEDQKPRLETAVLTSEMFEAFAFIPYEEGLEALVNQPMMGSMAHSVVIVKCPTEAKAKEVAAAMEANCDPAKWVCVCADDVRSATNGTLAMLMMTTNELGMGDNIMEAFKSIDKDSIKNLSFTVEE